MVVPACLGAVANDFHIQSVGEKRNAYRSLFLCLVQNGTRGSIATRRKLTDTGLRSVREFSAIYVPLKM